MKSKNTIDNESEGVTPVKTTNDDTTEQGSAPGSATNELAPPVGE